MSSIMAAFLLAFVRLLVKIKVLDWQQLREEFVQARKVIKFHIAYEAVDKEILKFLDIKEDPGKEKKD